MKALCPRRIVELYWPRHGYKTQMSKKTHHFPSTKGQIISGKKEAKVYQTAISRQFATLRTNISLFFRYMEELETLNKSDLFVECLI